MTTEGIARPRGHSKGRAAVLFAALLAASSVALGQAKLVITGSSTLAPLVAELAKGFQGARPGVAITVESGGSGRGIADARSGKADIGMVSRALTREEKDLFPIAIGRDGVAFIVHRDNPVRSLTREQVAAIYQGRLTSWKALGGREAPIRSVSRTPGHSSVEIVADYCGMKPADMRVHRVVEEKDELVRAVQEDRDALGFVSFGFAQRAAERGKPIRLVAVDGVAATMAELRAGRYPLSRQLNLVTRTVPTGAALEFLRYAQSAAARPAIEAHDFVPYLPLSRPAAAR